MNLYKVLQVDRDATPAEIKKSYFRLAKRHHPDKDGDKSEFQKVVLAYEILSDPKKRSHYDDTGELSKKNVHDEQFEDGIFYTKDMFKRPSNPVSRSPPEASVSNPSRSGGAGASLQTSKILPVKISIMESIQGCSKEIKLKRVVVCPKCRGQKNVLVNSRGCMVCGGTDPSCRYCGGSMEAFLSGGDMVKCDNCNGLGSLSNVVHQKVKFPPNVTNGFKAKLPLSVSKFPVVVRADVVMPMGWSRVGNNLVGGLSVTLEDALSGIHETVSTPVGNVEVVYFGKSPLQDGDVLIVSGRGFENGDLHLRVSLVWPSQMVHKDMLHMALQRVHHADMCNTCEKM